MSKNILVTLLLIQILQITVESINHKVITNDKLNQNQNVKLIRSFINSYGVTKLSSCKAQLDNGDIIDLTSLDNINALR